MRRSFIVAAVFILSISLSGCGQVAKLFGLPDPFSTPQVLISTTWSQSADLKASDMISYLESKNFCLPEAADFEAPSTDTDYGKAWAADQMRSCSDFETVDEAPGGCQMTFTASVGKDQLFEPKRSLVYEDGMSVLLLYGQNWQLEASPARGAADPLETTVKNCAPVVEKLIQGIGGQVNQYGDYK